MALSEALDALDEFTTEQFYRVEMRWNPQLSTHMTCAPLESSECYAERPQASTIPRSPHNPPVVSLSLPSTPHTSSTPTRLPLIPAPLPSFKQRSVVFTASSRSRDSHGPRKPSHARAVAARAMPVPQRRTGVCMPQRCCPRTISNGRYEIEGRRPARR